MSSLAATAIVTLLILALLAPLLVFVVLGRGLRPAAPVYAVLLVILVLWHVGIGFGEAPEGSAVAAGTNEQPDAAAALDAPAEEQCSEALDLAEGGDLILDRSDPARIVVNGDLWSQIPPRAQETLVGCVRAGAGLAADASVEVVER